MPKGYGCADGHLDTTACVRLPLPPVLKRIPVCEVPARNTRSHCDNPAKRSRQWRCLPRSTARRSRSETADLQARLHQYAPILQSLPHRSIRVSPCAGYIRSFHARAGSPVRMRIHPPHPHNMESSTDRSPRRTAQYKNF